VDERGELVNFQIDSRLVPHLRDAVTPGARTMETGSGISTIVLLALGARHTSVSPDGGEAERIRAYCLANDISVEEFTPIVGRSEDVLPSMPPGDELDLAIVDGNHAFPAPFIDWYYLTRMLKPCGVMVVDDVELWTGRVLADFLDAEAGIWIRLERTRRFAIYRLVGDKHDALARGWVDQPHVFNNSDLSITPLRRSSPLRVPTQAATHRIKRVVQRTWWKAWN